MREIKDAVYGGERPLFGEHDLRLEHVVIEPGESALKECRNIEAVGCEFRGKYPFWHVDRFVINKCLFTPGARAALWYSQHLTMTDTQVDAPKMFREMQHLCLRNVRIPDAQETLWHCSDVDIDDVQVDRADYLFMHGADIKIRNYRQQGNYSFQYCRNVEIHNAHIDSKDAFWNTEDVTIYDSEINGEYLGWYSQRLRLVRCRLSGTQPLCYCRQLELVDCTMAADCDLAFEDSDLTATVDSVITSVKNPRSGSIRARGYGQIILDENLKQPGNCQIVTE